MPLRYLALALALFLVGCGPSLPKWEKPLPRAEFQKVRTTAYTHSESDHLRYGAKNALGTPLLYGSVKSAAADWGRWPVGTVFKILATGEIYEVDDYGWALAGRNTIDLYKPTRSDMKRWGVQRVSIQILEWGDLRKSRQVLAPRKKYRHVKRMLEQIDDQL
jgi:3D (Asp-Asp-Asp) domain-containing protein